MSILRRVGGEHIDDAAAKTIGGSLLQSQAKCQAVGSLKADALDLVAETVRIVLGDLHSVGTPFFIDAHRHGGTKKLAEKHHGRTDPRLVLKILRDGARFFGRDTRDRRQPLGMILHDVKGLLTKLIHNALGGLGTNALDGAGRKIAQDRRLVGG